MEIPDNIVLSPYENFVYTLKAKETKRQYPHRLDMFLSFIGLEGSIEVKCTKLFELSKNIDLLHSHLIRFINFQKDRVQTMDISFLYLVIRPLVKLGMMNLRITQKNILAS